MARFLRDALSRGIWHACETRIFDSALASLVAFASLPALESPPQSQFAVHAQNKHNADGAKEFTFKDYCSHVEKNGEAQEVFDRLSQAIGRRQG